MRRTSIALMLSLTALASACGAPEVPAKAAPTEPGAETRSVDPAAAAAPAECAWPPGSEAQPPPACPPGCKWDGSKCKDERGIIVHQ
jgi:hypothetical protein